ncbi:MAG TPA: STAS domain-containing protein [Anaerolineae bacterium]|nr:STAS domain-containing protein [Anaerolineae bacterium]
MNIVREQLSPDTVLLHLDGQLDAKTGFGVRATLQELFQDEPVKIIVNLEKVSFIDSAGLASLVSGLRVAREKSSRVVLSAPQPQAQTVFRLTMLDRVFSIFRSVQDAQQSLG